MVQCDVEKYVGKPFEDRGRGPDSFDCWGLVKAIFQERGIDIPDYEISCFQTRTIGAQMEISRDEWHRLDEPGVPCLVVMKSDANHPTMCNHCGVYIGEGQFIHTLQKTGVIVTPLRHPYWRGKIEGFYRYGK